MDDLTALVRDEVSSHRPDVVPPFSAVVARHRRRARRRQGLAVVAVAVAVAGVVVAVPDRDRAPAPAAAAVVLDPEARPREGDVAPPDFTSPRGGPARRTCGRLRGERLVGRPGGRRLRAGAADAPGSPPGERPVRVGCELAGPASAPVQRPGRRSGRTRGRPGGAARRPQRTRPQPLLAASADGVVVPFTLAGSNCVLRPTPSTLSGGRRPGRSPRPGAAALRPPRPDADGELSVGIAHTAGTPAGLLPADRDDLRVSLELPASVRDGDPVSFVAVLSNPTDADVPLDPCPSWGAAQGREDSDSSSYGSRSGRLPCDRVREVPAHGELRFSLSLPDVAAGQPGRHDAARTTVRWGIAGPAAAEGTVAYTR